MKRARRRRFGFGYCRQICVRQSGVVTRLLGTWSGSRWRLWSWDDGRRGKWLCGKPSGAAFSDDDKWCPIGRVSLLRLALLNERHH